MNSHSASPAPQKSRTKSSQISKSVNVKDEETSNANNSPLIGGTEIATPRPADAEAQRAALDRQLRAPCAPETAVEAAKLLQATNDLLARHRKQVADLIRQRDELDATLHVTERQDAKAQAQARRERIDSLKRDFLEAEGARLAHVDQAQAALRLFVAEINAMFSAHEMTRQIARQLAPTRRFFGTFSTPELLNRLGGRISAALSGIKASGYSTIGRIGPLNLVNSSLTPFDRPWRDVDEKAAAAEISELLEV